MEDHCDLVEKFTEKLGANSAKNKSALYRDLKVEQTSRNFTYKDVISQVASSLKAIQNADRFKGRNSPKNNFLMSKHSMFCSVSQLCLDEQQNKTEKNKFETQCMTDTELIDIIEGAEAMIHNDNDNKHLVRTNPTNNIQIQIPHSKPYEIDSHIPQIRVTNNCDISYKKDSTNNTQNIERNVISKQSNPINNLEIPLKKQLSENDIFSEEEILQNEIQVKQIKKENLTQILNESLECEKDLCDLGVIFERDEVISSPIIKVRESKRFRSPLVFDLQSFEDFEKKTLPDLTLMDRNIEDVDLPHIETHENKQLELMSNNLKENLKAETEEIENYFISEDSRKTITPNMLLCHEILPASVTQKSEMTTQNILKDEILFSSDEEDHVNLMNELPFTCALETSFYSHQSQILDKTMFVAFQTASNKSIQINTDSFEKAKSIYDSTLQENDDAEPTLEQLVLKYDKNQIKSENCVETGASLNIETKCNSNKNISSNNHNLVKTETIDLEFPINKDDYIEDYELPTDIKKEFQDINLSPIFETKRSIDLDHPVIMDMENVPLKSQIKYDIVEKKGINPKSLIEIACKTIEEAGDNLNKFTKDRQTTTHGQIIQSNNSTTNSGSIEDVTNQIKIESKNIDTKKLHQKVIGQLSPILEIKSQILSSSNYFQFDFCDKMIIPSETRKTDMVHQNINNCTTSENINEMVIPETNALIVTFKTGNGKDIHISKSALETAHKKVKDITNDTSNTEISNEQFNGFKTASNKPIDITNEALLKSKQMLPDLCAESYPSTPTLPAIEYKKFLEETEVPKSLPEMKDFRIQKDDDTNTFKMPLPKKIKGQVVNSAIVTKKKSNKIIKCFPLENPNSNKDLMYDGVEENESWIDHEFNSYIPLNTDLFQEFTTASNKNIKISKHTFAKTKQIFHEIEEIDNALTTTGHKIENNSQVFVGFQTASNKKINISKEALLKTKDLFKDVDDFKENMNKNTDQNVFKRFQTASKKNIEVSKEALYKTKDLFQDIEEIANVVTDANVNERNEVSKGFQTASNNRIDATEMAVAETRNIFKDIDSFEVDSNNLKRDSNKNEFHGFQTASKKKIEISKEALAKTKRIFHDIEKIENDDCATNSNPCNNNQNFKGSQTANNKEVSVSEQALLKSKELLQSGIDSKKKDLNIFEGFQTASKKKIEISKEALEKTKHIFQNIEKNNDVVTTENRNQDRNSPIFTGFQTANKKEVKVSEEAILKSRELLQSVEDSKRSTSNVFDGFQTASNKTINVSNKALAMTKQLFQDIEGIDKIETIAYPNQDGHSPVFKGFQTANNNDVSVSRDAILKSKELLQSVENSEKKPSNIFDGFQTASNKTIKVSDKALIMTKQLFRDIEGINDVTEANQNQENICIGFQTASNKNMKVSKEALAKTRDIFRSFDDFKENNAQVNPKQTINGFQTAGNKKIEVSKEAVAKSKLLFQEIEGSENLITNSQTFCGFQTGNNKTIVVSEEAKLKSKQLLQKFSNNNSDTKGFQTANNKEINISKDALTKTKNLFKDFEIDCNSSLLNAFRNDNIETKSKKIGNKEIDLKNLLDTQVIDNLNNSLNTQDFSKEVKSNKRCGSPILSCPNAKRKCFKTPYIMKGKPKIVKDTCNQNTEKSITVNKNYKKTKKYTLKDLTNMEQEKTNPKTDPYILGFDFDSLHKFEFKGERNNLTKEDAISINQIKDYFTKTIANPKLIPENWLDIQLRLILWKLISYEIRFPKTMHGACNTGNVIDQLTYRYTKELYNVERPILRKILEKDDVSTRTMILCVVKIFQNNPTKAEVSTELLVTDGWYTLKASLDRMLARMVVANKIFVGCKLACNGAELLNCEQGVAPWEDTSSIRLKLFGNSTRLAKWDAKLGLHRCPAINTGLRAVHIDGGKISKVRVFVTRVYPMLYVEKFDDGSTVTRSERLEMQHQIKYETERDAIMEKLYEQVEKEIEQDSQDSNSDSGKRRCLDSGSQIAKMIRRSTDPTQFKASLTASQNRLLEDHTTKIRANLLKSIEARVQDKLVHRNVVSLLKVRVVSVLTGDTVDVKKGVLSIWRPNEMMFEIIKEGVWLDVMNITPTAERFGEIQLTAGRQTTYSEPKKRINEKLNALTKPLLRDCHTIKYLAQNPSYKPDYGEIDTVGLIFSIEPSNSEFDTEKNKNNFQNVYLTDADKNFLCVNFWGGIKKFGYESILDTGQIIAGINLQRRAGNTRKNIQQYRATEYTYFTKTPKNQTTKIVLEECIKHFNSIDKRKFCNDCLELKTNYALCKFDSPYKFNNSDLSKNRTFNNISIVSKVNCPDVDLNLTGLDFESTFRQRDTQELSPKMLQRKKQINEKIARLKNYYGEPPPLSPIHILNQTKQATSVYKSPMLNSSDLNKSNSSLAKHITPQKRASSPILSSNSKKLNLSSVKLNLVNKINSEDQFVGEFDASPPLSLD